MLVLVDCWGHQRVAVESEALMQKDAALCWTQTVRQGCNMCWQAAYVNLHTAFRQLDCDNWMDNELPVVLSCTFMGTLG